MKHHIRTLFVVHALACSALAQTTGQWELRKRTTTGMQSYGITAENGKAIGFTAGLPAMLPITASTAWADITGKPSTFPPEAHTQAISTITGLQDALDAKLATATAITTYQPLDTDLSAIAALTTTSYGRGLLTTADAATLRSANGLNSASNITTGSLALARLASGGAAEGNLLVWDSFGTTWQPRTLAQIIGPGVATTALNVASTDNSYPQISFGSAIGGTAAIIVDNLTANRAHNLPDGDGTYALTSNIDGTLANNSITNAMLAGSIALSKLAQSAATSGQVIAWNGTAWAPATASSGLPLSGGTLTGALSFSGTTHAGLQLNNLTTTQRDALSGTAAGRVLWNTTTSRLNVHDGTSWTAGFTRLAGDTMTGALNITAGTATASTPPLSITQTWNNAAVTFRGIEFAATNTTSNASSTLIRLLGGASGTTQAFAITASTGAASIGAANNSATITLQGSDRSAVASLGAFGNEFRFTNIQLGTTNAAIRFTDANAVTRYGTLYGQDTDVLALRNGSGGTTGAAWELLEMTAPGTPAADRVRVYVEDTGGGKSRLVVKWSDGTTTVIATQP